MSSLRRRVPTDWQHVEKYPLRVADVPTVPTPSAIGVNWYSNFDNPVYKDGHWWVGLTKDLGYIRGGHCVALKQRYATDRAGWWDYYNQGQEGACVGFGSSRMMSLINRKKYAARWLYLEAQLVDEYADTPPEEGTSVNAAMKILKAKGHCPVDAYGFAKPVSLAEGISAYRWATDVNDLLRILGYQDKNYVDFINSWEIG